MKCLWGGIYLFRISNGKRKRASCYTGGEMDVDALENISTGIRVQELTESLKVFF